MANILAIETATDACSAALLINDSIQEKYQVAVREHARLILPMANSLLAEAGLKLSSLHAIAFGCGPGSFTGVRVAAGITQGLALGVDLPVLPISSLRIAAQTAYAETNFKKVLAVFDARMREIYWGAYVISNNGLMQEVIKDSLSKPEDINMPEDERWFGAGSGWDVYAPFLIKKLSGKVKNFDGKIYPHAREAAKLACADYLAGKAISADKALPIYLRSGV